MLWICQIVVHFEHLLCMITLSFVTQLPNLDSCSLFNCWSSCCSISLFSFLNLAKACDGNLKERWYSIHILLAVFLPACQKSSQYWEINKCQLLILTNRRSTCPSGQYANLNKMCFPVQHKMSARMHSVGHVCQFSLCFGASTSLLLQSSDAFLHNLHSRVGIVIYLNR